MNQETLKSHQPSKKRMTKVIYLILIILISIFAFLLSLIIPEFKDLSFSAILTYSMFIVKEQIEYFKNTYKNVKIFWKEICLIFIISLTPIILSTAIAGNIFLCLLLPFIIIIFILIFPIFKSTLKKNIDLLDNLSNSDKSTQYLEDFCQKYSISESFTSYPSDSSELKVKQFYLDLKIHNESKKFSDITIKTVFKIFIFIFFLFGINRTYYSATELSADFKVQYLGFEFMFYLIQFYDILLVYAFNMKLTDSASTISEEFTQLVDISLKKSAKYIFLITIFIFLGEFYLKAVLGILYFYASYVALIFKYPFFPLMYSTYFYFMLRYAINIVLIPIFILTMISFFRILLIQASSHDKIIFKKVAICYKWYPIIIILVIFEAIIGILQSETMVQDADMVFGYLIPIEYRPIPFIELGSIIIIGLIQNKIWKQKPDYEQYYISKTKTYFLFLFIVLSLKYIIIGVEEYFFPSTSLERLVIPNALYSITALCFPIIVTFCFLFVLKLGNKKGKHTKNILISQLENNSIDYGNFSSFNISLLLILKKYYEDPQIRKDELQNYRNFSLYYQLFLYSQSRILDLITFQQEDKSFVTTYTNKKRTPRILMFNQGTNIILNLCLFILSLIIFHLFFEVNPWDFQSSSYCIIFFIFFGNFIIFPFGFSIYFVKKKCLGFRISSIYLVLILWLCVLIIFVGGYSIIQPR